MSEKWTGPQVDPQFHGFVETAVVAGTIGLLNITMTAREQLAAHALRPEDVEWACNVYVKVDTWDDALQKARNESVVGLIGDPGSSRWITGVNLAACLDLTPRLLELDPDDRTRPLPAEETTCYLIDLASTGELATPGLGAKLREHADVLAGVGSRLLILATHEEWRVCGLAGSRAWVPVRGPEPLDVFRAHLTALQSDSMAAEWVSIETTIEALAGVTSADAVWLSTLVDTATRRGRGREAAVDEIFQAYRDWPEVVGQLLASTAREEDGYQRALAVAVAVLENASAGQVFAAADVMSETVGLARPPGAGLVGPGASAMLASIEAELVEDCVYFPRIGYGPALLDHMWRDRHHFRAQLRDWFANAPRKREVGGEAVWASAITRLAIRHQDPELVIAVAKRWVGGETNALAVQALSDAAVSDGTGPAVRRRLYYWATHSETSKWHALTADVCAGEMGRSYPRIALTRLRHLATQGADTVRGKVVAAMIGLATEPTVRHEVIQEIADWLNSEKPARRATGRPTFLALVQTADEGPMHLLVAMLETPDEIRILSDCWWSVLRDPASRSEARDSLVRWLDAAIKGRLPYDEVLDCLAGTCRSALDAGDLGFFLRGWASSADGDGFASVSRVDVFDELSRRIARQGGSTVQKATLTMAGMLTAAPLKEVSDVVWNQ